MKDKNKTDKTVINLAKFSRTILAAIMASSLVSGASALTTAESSSILFMKQEEKLARDVYQVLSAKWGGAIFANIAVSEQRHMDALDGLIAKYRLKDTTPAQAGKFTYPELQSLYEQLVSMGTESLEDALAVGVLIETTDIEDLEAALQTIREKPIRNVYSNLLNGSYNHLAAFTSALD